MKRALIALLLGLATAASTADQLDRTPLEALTVNGEKVRLFPNGRWEYADPAKAAAAQQVAAKYPENQAPPAGAQGGVFGVGRTVVPGDKDYNRGSLNPKLGLLAAEITAVTGKDPGRHYQELAARHGTPHYLRIDATASPAQKAAFKQLTAERVSAATLAGKPIVAKLTRAAGNDAPIGGLKVVTQNGWFAARPSGTEDIYKVYAESFTSAEHLQRVVAEAQEIVTATLAG